MLKMRGYFLRELAFLKQQSANGQFYFRVFLSHQLNDANYNFPTS